MLECQFASWLGLELGDFSMWHFLECITGDFLQVLGSPPLLHQLMISANGIKLKINESHFCTFAPHGVQFEPDKHLMCSK